MTKVLFVAVGEAEVPAFETIAKSLGANGIATRLVTWLPRLATKFAESLERMSGRVCPQHDVADVLAGGGIADISMAADYDRDWHFAGVASKRRHVSRVYAALAQVFDEFQPDLVVSSVGGETTRIISDAIARSRGVQTAYFNAVPIPGRFTILRSLDAPFVPYEGAGTSFKPAAEETLASQCSGEPGKNGQAPQTSSPLEGLHRLWAQSVGREKTYPITWIPRKAVAVMKQELLRRTPTKSDGFRAGHVKVLYPLHDERDFQVAVRERHAIPQASLLSYVSSVIPPEYQLYVKPHPEHASAHHTLLWRNLASRPNVTFLDARTPASEAIESCDIVFTLASSLGFEALQAGKPVVSYGRPFYGNRGLTTDVADPRDIAKAIEDTVGTKPSSSEISQLVTTMKSWSWEGSFTPLVMDSQNLQKLADAVQEVVTQL
ncbi:capsular polysaccharide export protein, LipB/KpsS family [Pseudarthrobacter enclensis]|uniref:capsular polysaccharide export protein, LipB/KpsS family n=1 Tax=Pseudarthrobacter enclensis TaxID=993070 RepID=UPI00130DFF6F|nr:hypothetical protein [Pseudarthrobacter enclensis]